MNFGRPQGFDGSWFTITRPVRQAPCIRYIFNLRLGLNLPANALGLFSPAITLVLYAVVSAAYGKHLDTQTAFTTMAILSMVTHPANMVMTIVPQAVAALSGFQRIQEFMLRPSLHSRRLILPGAPLGTVSYSQASEGLAESHRAIHVRDLRIGHQQPLLMQVNIDIAVRSMVIIAEPTGSGKSTLLRTILGEVVPAEGSITLSSRKIAYCAQRPWLPNSTIKEAIYGATDIYSPSHQDHDLWYHVVTRACCLTHDFGSLADGDQTQIGSRGLNLSGGQRQRVVSIITYDVSVLI